jgi:hypothetical protein
MEYPNTFILSPEKLWRFNSLVIESRGSCATLLGGLFDMELLGDVNRNDVLYMFYACGTPRHASNGQLTVFIIINHDKRVQMFPSDILQNQEFHSTH